MLKHLTIRIFKIQEPYITKIRPREWLGSKPLTERYFT